MLIGITGQIGSGKTTSAGWLNNKYGFGVFAFATPLKNACVALTGLPMKYFTDKDLKREVIPWMECTSRRLMQTLATEYVRNTIHPDFWINRMERELQKSYVPDNVVIDDIRFSNEAKYIHDHGGKVIHIIRGEQKSSHSSEIVDFPVDFVIDNNGDMDTLTNQLKYFMEIFHDC